MPARPPPHAVRCAAHATTSLDETEPLIAVSAAPGGRRSAPGGGRFEMAPSVDALKISRREETVLALICVAFLTFAIVEMIYARAAAPESKGSRYAES